MIRPAKGLTLLLLAPLLVRHADHRRLGDLGVLLEALLDLEGIDVLGVAQDHVPRARVDEEVAHL